MPDVTDNFEAAVERWLSDNPPPPDQDTTPTAEAYAVVGADKKIIPETIAPTRLKAARQWLILIGRLTTTATTSDVVVEKLWQRYAPLDGVEGVKVQVRVKP